MKVSTVFLVLCFCLFVFSLNAQVQPGGIDKKNEKYISKTGNISNLSSDQSVLVRFNHSLTAAEIQLLKPQKSLSGDYYIVQKSNVSNFSNSIIYQEKANGLWKLSDRLMKVLSKGNKKNDSVLVRLAFKNINALPKAVAGLNIKSTDHINQICTVYLSPGDFMWLLELDDVLYADVLPVAKEEVVINGLDLSLNQISNARNLYPDIDGGGINVSFKEGMYDAADLDLLGKTVPGATIGKTPTTHATIMATLALGKGNSFIRGLGAAPKARLAYSDFTNLMPDLATDLNKLQVKVQNHSYGTDIDNDYGMEAAAYDKQIFETDTLIHVFSAGNKGTATPTAGFYQNITARANLTGNFKQAKNLLVIGGINRENIAENLSSKGPAYDGRVKPELVALGEDGTSGAAAITSGSIALVEQFYQQKYKKPASASLIRATLINAADDLGTPQVDFIYGYGKLNVAQSLKTLDENRASLYEVAKNQDMLIPLTIPANVAEVKVTIAWNDPPAIVNAAQSLVNGLDLSLETPAGNLMLPWVLSSFPHLDSLSKPAVRKADLLNNVQQVTLDQPSAGAYTVHVRGNRINSGNTQPFALAYRYTFKNTFSFVSPVKNEYFFANEDNYIRWENTYTGKTGNLSVSYDEGSTWKSIAAGVDLSKGVYHWVPPDLFVKAIIKMEVGDNVILSQSFVISRPRVLNVGYACKDGLVLSWNPQPGAKDYTLYNIKDDILSPVLTLADTIVKLDASKINSNYFAVAANGAGFTGLKSYTIDYTQQGIACYIKNLSASVNEDQIRLDLNIGTTLDLKNIIWEKQTGPNTFSVLQQTKPISNQLDYTVFDDKPKTGIQFYRVTFETAGGRVQSDLVSVVYLKENEFSFFPNPVTDYLTILSGSFEDYSLSIFNMLGQKVFEEKATSSNKFALNALSTGVYVGVINKNGQQLKKIKLIKK
ncbi:S8 family serine peptidase [uncultured Pedobacter sp.]|uniref:S8 family serine peptidase n=1 Tax=uncultured Pedobacter sp. TaxID=246139 RepID=UPI0025E50DCD|nr:S8 family serine peptidase [uncultured Pedobacter sp.]